MSTATPGPPEFTLIELLVVIAIIGVLVALLAPRPSRRRARGGAAVHVRQTT